MVGNLEFPPRQHKEDVVVQIEEITVRLIYLNYLLPLKWSENDNNSSGGSNLDDLDWEATCLC